QERDIDRFPSPDELWQRLRIRIRQGLDDTMAQTLLTSSYHASPRTPRYYQEIAINRAVQAVVQGKSRILLTMATGTGKTTVAFQICWKLWNASWNRNGLHRRPKILFLADRSILVDDPKDKDFAPFADARWKIENGVINKGREMYFALYQALAEDERRPGLYREYPEDFFDLIVVDECHRGSAHADSMWREILEYFAPAVQLGLTATPLNEESRNSYEYFGLPIYQYSLRQGIDDGFLAPYRVHRVVSTYDAVGWRPSTGDKDRYGREIPDEEYTTKDFERVISLRRRTEAIARHLTEFLKKTDRFAKTLVFCVDQEHALDMRQALTNLNSDLVRQFPDYVCRVTADEAEIGRGHLSRFQDVESASPVILTTSQLLTTGVDAPTCKNVVLARVIGSMVEFKQIIGRGTRLRDDYGKLYFNILDYTGSATRLFADPAFDGDPVAVIEETTDEDGAVTSTRRVVEDPPSYDTGQGGDPPSSTPPSAGHPRKLYFDGGQVEIAAHMVYELDAEGNRRRVVRLIDYAREKVLNLYPDADALHAAWTDPVRRAEIVAALAQRGIDFDTLSAAARQPDADLFDLLCHVAFGAPLRTRRERAERLRREHTDFFDHYGPEARAILQELLEKYAEYGNAQVALPEALKVPPISNHGNVGEIMRLFGGGSALKAAVEQLQALLYVA
ncbi:MAG: EcoAI/FtnUII family type I restriction enzme subunit R, partial [Chloroflexota bacterium]